MDTGTLSPDKLVPQYSVTLRRFSPEWRFLKHAMEFANENTTGEASIRLHKANVLLYTVAGCC